MKVMHQTVGGLPALACASALLASTVLGGAPSPKVAPPNSKAFGQSLAAWQSQYLNWLTLGPVGPEVVGHMLFPLITELSSITGSGTFDDPLVLTGHGEVTVKAGTAWMTPLLAWTSEIYADGSRDALPTLEWWNTYAHLDQSLTLDGKAVITEENIQKFFFEWIYNPPMVYAEPTPYGSVARYATDGWGAVFPPLSVGVHEISWAATLAFPSDNGLLPYESGLTLRFSNTINVVP